MCGGGVREGEHGGGIGGGGEIPVSSETISSVLAISLYSNE